MKKGVVIFGFNGTLFWDSEYQEISWDKYLETYSINMTMAQKKRIYTHISTKSLQKIKSPFDDL